MKFNRILGMLAFVWPMMVAANTTVINITENYSQDMLRLNGYEPSVYSCQQRIGHTNEASDVTAENWAKFATNPAPHSATCTGWLLTDMGRNDQGRYYRRYSCLSFNSESTSSFDELIDNKGSISKLTAEQIRSIGTSVIVEVLSDEKMPVGIQGLFDLGVELKSRLFVPENLNAGCYVFMGDVIGVDPTAIAISLQKSLSPLPENIFADSAHLQTLVIPANVEVSHAMLRACTNLRHVVVGDARIARTVLDACPSVTNLAFAEGVKIIPDHLLDGCDNVCVITIPSSVTEIGDGAFSHCSSLRAISFLGDAPEMGCDPFYGTPRRMVVNVPKGSIGWNGSLSEDLPDAFLGRAVVHSGETSQSGEVEDDRARSVCLTTTNVVIHYVTQSISSDMAAPITADTAILNVMTEIKGGCLAIPESWKSNYPSFEERFGSNFGEALLKLSGKTDAAGNQMLVWQDYVAGTDPTDLNSKFVASLTIVEGKPVVSWSPELSAEEAAKRVYRIFGKVRLQDAGWVEVPKGHEVDYNFFKVTVEMQ